MLESEIKLKSISEIEFKVSGNWSVTNLADFTRSINAIYDAFLLDLLIANTNETYFDDDAEIEREYSLRSSIINTLIKDFLKIHYQFPNPFEKIHQAHHRSDLYASASDLISGSMEEKIEFIKLARFNIEKISIASPGDIRLSGLAAIIEQLGKLFDKFRYRKEDKELKQLNVKKERQKVEENRIKILRSKLEMLDDLSLSESQKNHLLINIDNDTERLEYFLIREKITRIKIIK